MWGKRHPRRWADSKHCLDPSGLIGVGSTPLWPSLAADYGPGWLHHVLFGRCSFYLFFFYLFSSLFYFPLTYYLFTTGLLQLASCKHMSTLLWIPSACLYLPVRFGILWVSRSLLGTVTGEGDKVLSDLASNANRTPNPYDRITKTALIRRNQNTRT